MQDKVTIARFVEGLQRIKEEAHEIPVSIMITLFGVVQLLNAESKAAEEISFSEIATHVHIPFQTVSRHLRYLGKGITPGQAGLGLVDTEEQPMNRRKKFVFLTPKGKRFVSQFMAISGITL
jgi:DNA-binding MarR family transcriptional regulator